MSPSRTRITLASTLTCWVVVEAEVVVGVVGKGAIVVGTVVGGSDEVGAEVVGVIVGGVVVGVTVDNGGFEVVFGDGVDDAEVVCCCAGVEEGNVLFGVASGCGLVILDCTTTAVDWFVD